MNTLFTFGCSFTEGFTDETSLSQPYLEYKKLKGGVFPKSWPTVLSEHLNYKLKNYGEGASGNQQIFQEVCKRCHEFGFNDIVIIEWTFLQRYRMVLDNTWLKLGPSKINNPRSPISEECHESIVLNRTLKPYVDELYDYENIVNKLSKSVGFNVFYWSIDNGVLYNVPNLNEKNHYLLNDMIEDRHDNAFTITKRNGGYKIIEETDGKIIDYHLGGTGHKVMGDLFYRHIIKHI
jgi:hypothetical protein